MFSRTLDGCCQFPKAKTISPANSRMTTVRTNVAKSELTFSMPTFAKMAVRAANAADSKAQNTQESIRFFMSSPEQAAAPLSRHRRTGLPKNHHTGK